MWSDVGVSHCNTELNCYPSALIVSILQILAQEVRPILKYGEKHQRGEQAGMLPRVTEIKAPEDMTRYTFGADQLQLRLT